MIDPQGMMDNIRQLFNERTPTQLSFQEEKMLAKIEDIIYCQPKESRQKGTYEDGYRNGRNDGVNEMFVERNNAVKTSLTTAAELREVTLELEKRVQELTEANDSNCNAFGKERKWNTTFQKQIVELQRENVQLKNDVCDNRNTYRMDRDEKFKGMENRNRELEERESARTLFVSTMNTDKRELKDEIVHLKNDVCDGRNAHRIERDNIMGHFKQCEDNLNERTKELSDAQARVKEIEELWKASEDRGIARAFEVATLQEKIKEFEEAREERKRMVDKQEMINMKLRSAGREMLRMLKSMKEEPGCFYTQEIYNKWEMIFDGQEMTMDKEEIIIRKLRSVAREMLNILKVYHLSIPAQLKEWEQTISEFIWTKPTREDAFVWTKVSAVEALADRIEKLENLHKALSD